MAFIIDWRIALGKTCKKGAKFEILPEDFKSAKPTGGGVVCSWLPARVFYTGQKFGRRAGAEGTSGGVCGQEDSMGRK